MNSTEKKIILDAEDLDRIITRLCYQITEANHNLDDIVLIGIHRRGVPLAVRIKNKIREILNKEVYQGSLDISFHRDDYRERLELPEVRGTDIDISLNGEINSIIASGSDSNSPWKQQSAFIGTDDSDIISFPQKERSDENQINISTVFGSLGNDVIIGTEGIEQISYFEN